MKIRTYTGRLVDPMNLRESDIDIIDIAQSLAHVNRFLGHTERPLSVAAHSRAVAVLCPPHLRLHGLLHDASEAYLCDIPSPLKQTHVFHEYRMLERNVTATIQRAFGLIPADEHATGEWPDEVHEADALAGERENGFRHRYVVPDVYELPPHKSAAGFIDTFNHYRRRLPA